MTLETPAADADADPPAAALVEACAAGDDEAGAGDEEVGGKQAGDAHRQSEPLVRRVRPAHVKLKRPGAVPG